MVTRAEDIRFVQENYEIFSHEEFMIPRTPMPLKPLPLAVDPPMHARYREVINPGFMPGKVAKMRDDARDLTLAIIRKMQHNGGCASLDELTHGIPVTWVRQHGEL